MRCGKPSQNRPKARRKGISDPRDPNLGTDAESSHFFVGFSFFMSSAFCGRPLGYRRLDLDLAETVLPDGSEGGDTVITEVNQDVPRKVRKELVSMG
jgi:hypothetical protein